MAIIPVTAQVTPADQTANPGTSTVQLSPYTVSSTQDTGYLAESATPYKTQQQLIDIPQAITVVTRDMLNDIPGYDMSDIIIYAGGVPKYGNGETYQLRGSDTATVYPLLDGQIYTSPFLDDSVVDSIDVIRGPAALLYPNSALSGVINKTSRRPQPIAMNSIEASITDYGLYRTQLYTTGPVGQLGDGQLDYLVIGGYQGGSDYWANTKDDRTFIHPSFQWKDKNTTVFVAVDYEKLTQPSNPTGLLQPDGKIFTGIGLRNSLLLPPGAEETHVTKALRGIVVQELSSTWEARVGFDLNHLHREGSIVLPLVANWNTRTVGFYNRLNNISIGNDSLSFDVTGKYDVLGMKNQSSFGLTTTVNDTVTELWVNSNFGGPGQVYNYRPIDNPDVATLPVLPINSYVAPANPGTDSRSVFSNFYWLQSVDVIPDHLSLIGGVAKYVLEQTNQANLTLNTATRYRVAPTLYRGGIVVHFFDKALTFYAMQADTQLPPSVSILANGSTAPAPSGTGKEAGVKLRLWGGKVNVTISDFDLVTTGLTVFGGVLPNGQTYVLPLGRTTAKGFDGEVTASITKNWQLLGTFYNGTVKDQTGAPVSDSYTSSLSVFTKYNIVDGNMKGLSLGFGFSRIAGRVTSTSALTYTNQPAFITNVPALEATAFLNYNLNRNWSFKLQVNNLFNQVHAVGINSATLDAPAIGRAFTFQAGYRW